MTKGRILFSQIDQETLIKDTIVQLGYSSQEKVNKNILDKIWQLIEECWHLADCHYIYDFIPYVNNHNGIVQGGNGICIESKKLSFLIKKMSGVEYLCCLAVTIGSELDRKIRKVNETSMLESFILDALASRIIEAFANILQERIFESCKSRGLQISARFSPGYCDWEILTGQEQIFQVLDPNIINIMVSPTSGLMIPRKSISAIIIVAQDVPYQTPCPFCRKKDCDHRRWQAA
jgi:hypothetical protein